MPSICFYFQVHQPYRIQKYRFFDIGNKHDYFLEDQKFGSNYETFCKVANKCYLPANEVLLRTLKKFPEFRLSFSFSGVFLEQAKNYYPEVIDSFRVLVDTGRVEVLAETYYHSLSFLYSKTEFEYQVKKHENLVYRIFGVKPKVFRNTELIYNNQLAKTVEKLGYKGIITEGVDSILDWRSSNFLYQAYGTENLKLLLKNYRLSDDIAFRFSQKSWSDYPLTADKFGNWLKQINGNGELINLFMDYETFGEHQWAETGIFEFLEHLPQAVKDDSGLDFVTPTEALERYMAHDVLDIPNYISWADSERDLSAWRSNHLQYDALDKIYKLEDRVLSSQNLDLIEDWRKLQTSDHFYYMCTKFWSDGDVHKYFSPYQSPYEAYIYYVNVLQDLEIRLQKESRILEYYKKPLPARLVGANGRG